MTSEKGIKTKALEKLLQILHKRAFNIYNAYNQSKNHIIDPFPPLLTRAISL